MSEPGELRREKTRPSQQDIINDMESGYRRLAACSAALRDKYERLVQQSADVVVKFANQRDEHAALVAAARQMVEFINEMEPYVAEEERCIAEALRDALPKDDERAASGTVGQDGGER